MATLKRCTLAVVLILVLTLTTAVPAFAATPTEEGVTTVAPRSSASIKGETISIMWAKLDGEIGLLMADGTARATLNVASPCTAYIRIVNSDTGAVAGVTTMNVTAGNTGRNITFTLSPNPLHGGIYDVYVMFDKAGIRYSLTVNCTVN